MRIALHHALLVFLARHACASQHVASDLKKACNQESGEDCGFEVIQDTAALVESDAETPSKGAKAIHPAEQVDVAGTMSSFWTNPITLGLMLGLLLIGPDHLGTLMALSTLTTGLPSFKVGFAWGLGHSLGMILLCPMFYLLREMSAKSFSLSVDQWEYYGDYFIGASMVLVAVYFVVYESVYLQRNKDGTYTAKGCACHTTSKAHHADPDAESGKVSFCKSYQAPCGHRAKRDRQIPGAVDHEHSDHDMATDSIQEDTPLLEKSADEPTSNDTIVPDFIARYFSVRDIQGALLGALQGLCCPMGLAGVGFMGRMSMTASAMMLLAFAMVFVMASAVGSGAITFGWGAITSSGSGGCLSPRSMYMFSCVATFFLGLVWIAANYYGVLHHINFAEHIQDKIMPHAIHVE